MKWQFYNGLLYSLKFGNRGNSSRMRFHPSICWSWESFLENTICAVGCEILLVLVGRRARRTPRYGVCGLSTAVMLASALMIERKATIVLEAGSYIFVSGHEFLEGRWNDRDGSKHPFRRGAEGRRRRVLEMQAGRDG